VEKPDRAERLLTPEEKKALKANPLSCISQRYIYSLQIELLRRYRNDDTDERTRRAIHPSIDGVAAGLRNSG